MVDYYYNHQIANKGNATKAFKDFMDYYECAAPEFREQISMEIMLLLIAKGKLKPEINDVVNQILGYRNFINQAKIDFQI